MGKYLITPSLLSSWLYIYKAYESYEGKAYEGFLQTLKREPTEKTPAMLAGIEFEEVVNEITQGVSTPKATQIHTKIASIVQGGQSQVALHKRKNISNIEFLLYGRLDWLKAGTIYDIKFTKRYDTGKYFDSIQHHFYLELCPEAFRFSYLISDGEDFYTESYRRSNDDILTNTISNFVDYLKANNLLEMYFEHWKAKY